jgi:glutathionylspermidine synthase
MKDGWLDKTCPAEKCFIDINGEEISRFNSEQISYYKIDNNLFLNLGTTSNEIHRIFMEATNRVINDDELMIRCGIPEVFWSRIRQSWINDQNLQITGRIDLAFNGKELKVFKYNADSASALFQCAIIQQKWANAFKLEYHLLAGFQMHRALVNNWKHMNIN